MDFLQNEFNLINLILQIPLIALVLIGICRKWEKSGIVEIITSLFSILEIILVICLRKKFNENYIYTEYLFLDNYNIYYFLNKDFGINQLDLGIDGLGLTLILLTVVLFYFCTFAISKTIENKSFFYMLFFLLEFFVIFSFLVLDYLYFYVLFEAILIPMFLIIGIWGSRERRIKAANYFLFYAFFGSIFMLLGILLLYYTVGSTNLIDVLSYNFDFNTSVVLWFLFFMGFAVKVPLWPFHVWLPEAHVEAPTAGSMLLAGILLKLAGFGLLRFVLPVFWTSNAFFMPYASTLCLIGIYYASMATMRQVDLKKIVAYSSVAHMSVSVIGIISFSIKGMLGGIIVMVAHGLISSVLFYLIGIIYDNHGTRFIKYYGGLASVCPKLAFFFLIFSFANVGLPGLALFPAEFLIIMSAFSMNMVVGVLVALSGVFTVIYTILVYNRVFFGTLKDKTYFIKSGETVTINNKYKDLTLPQALVLTIATILLIVLGLHPQLIIDMVYDVVIIIKSRSK